MYKEKNYYKELREAGEMDLKRKLIEDERKRISSRKDSIDSDCDSDNMLDDIMIKFSLCFGVTIAVLVAIWGICRAIYGW